MKALVIYTLNNETLVHQEVDQYPPHPPPSMAPQGVRWFMHAMAVSIDLFISGARYLLSSQPVREKMMDEVAGAGWCGMCDRCVLPQI